MSRINLSSLHTFCEVADCLSFTQAAHRLFRTQPALSRQITQLERELGIELFIRQGRSVALTAAGEDLYGRAKRLLSEANEFQDRAQALAQGDLGTLRVGAHPLLFSRTVPSLLTAYAKRWQNISVNVSEGGAASLMARVEARDLDVALARYMTSDALAAKRLFPMYLIAIMSTGHRLAMRGSLEVSDLQNEPLLLMSADAGSRVLLEQVCREDGLRLRQVVLESSIYNGLISMATAGHGIAIVLSMVSFSHPKARIVPVMHHGRHVGTWSAVLWQRGTTLAPYVQAFIKIAIRQAKVDYPGKQYGFPLLEAGSNPILK